MKKENEIEKFSIYLLSGLGKFIFSLFLFLSSIRKSMNNSTRERTGLIEGGNLYFYLNGKFTLSVGAPSRRVVSSCFLCVSFMSRSFCESRHSEERLKTILRVFRVSGAALCVSCPVLSHSKLG